MFTVLTPLKPLNVKACLAREVWAIGRIVAVKASGCRFLSNVRWTLKCVVQAGGASNGALQHILIYWVDNRNENQWGL